MTKDMIEKVPWIEKNGQKFFVSDGEYQKIAVIERHKNTGKMGVGIVKGYGSEAVPLHPVCPMIPTISL